MQIAAVAAIAAIGFWTYALPLVKPWLEKARASAGTQPKNSSMQQVESVLAIRDSSQDKDIIAACNALLHTLLKVTA
jgi:hypothetical protein